ncbi:MAG: peptide deformylase [Patescibacteria group bacterium]
MAAEIVQNGHPVLRATIAEVPESMFGTHELKKMLKEMEVALDGEADGVALAAPQIALPYRIFIVRYDRMVPRNEGETPAPEVGVFINPKIIKSSRRRVECDEGCLSVRGVYGKTERYERATVIAYDADGKKFERGGGGILAQAYQHEIDHLDGILFIDHAHDTYTMEPVSDMDHEPFVFFGTPYVAADTLELLHFRGITPALIVTSADAPRGRGMQMMPSETKEWALKHQVPVIAVDAIDDSVHDTIAAYGPSYGIAVAFGKILPESLINAFPKGILNIHYSLLPKYRGASPVEGALLNGETETGVTIQKMVYELDAGDIIASKKVAIGPEETTRELRARLIEDGANLLADTLHAYEQGILTPVPQEHTKATHSGKIAKEDGELTLSGDAKKNWNTYRAYAESPGTYFFAEKTGKKIRVKIKSATYGNGAFMPLRVVPEGKTEMDYQDFLRGGYAAV